jgi:hypothetical protein
VSVARRIACFLSREGPTAVAQAIRELCLLSDLGAMRKSHQESETKYTAEESCNRLMSIDERTIGKDVYDKRSEMPAIPSVMPIAINGPI